MSFNRASRFILYCCLLSIWKAYELSLVPDGYAELGEALHWDTRTQSMLYTDVMTNRLLRFDYPSQRMFACRLVGAKYPSFILPIRRDNTTTSMYAVGCGRQVCVVSWDGHSDRCAVQSVLFTVQQGALYEGMRFNDGKCDKHGRLFTGTMLHHEAGNPLLHRRGVLYKYDDRLEKPHKLSVVLRNIGISNGLAFNRECDRFYYIDTLDYDVKEFQYNAAHGIARKPRVVYSFAANGNDPLYPDGMTIDSKGLLYITIANDGRLRVINPSTSKHLYDITLPCDQVSAAAFGGPDLNELWITTTAINNRTAPCGCTYKALNLQAHGFQMNTIRLGRRQLKK